MRNQNFIGGGFFLFVVFCVGLVLFGPRGCRFWGGNFLIDLFVNFLNNMATFKSANVSEA